MTSKFMRGLREMSDSELYGLETKLRTELSSLRTKEKRGFKIDNTAQFRNIRRNIARIMTLKHERGSGG